MMSGLDIQTIITLASLLLNVKEVHGWFDSRTIQQKALVLWHVYSSMSDILLATLWWCMRADGSINRPASVKLGHSVGFSEWTTGSLSYIFWAVLGLKALTQFPAQVDTRRQQLLYLTYCYVVTVAAHFPFICCVLEEEHYNGWIITVGVGATLVCYVIYIASELTFRLQAPDPWSAAHAEVIATLRFGVEVWPLYSTLIPSGCRAPSTQHSVTASSHTVRCVIDWCAVCVCVGQWFYLMIMVLPFSNWQLTLPDYFLLGYAVRVLLWLAYTAVMSKASSALDEVQWLMFKPVKGGRPGEYEEVGQVEEPKGQVPFADGGSDGGGGGDDDDSDDDDDDEDGSGEDIGEDSSKEKEKKQKQHNKKKPTRRPTRAPTRQSSARGPTDDGGGDSVEREKRRVAKGDKHPVMDAVAGSAQLESDGRGSEAVKARVNGETVILIKKPKAAAAAGASSASGGATEGGGGQQHQETSMHSLDIHDDSKSSNKSEKKGR